MLRIPPPNVGDERQPAPRHPNGSQRSSAMVPRQGNTDTATWCVLGSSARLGEAPQASPLRRLSAFSHRAISFHENSARDRGMSRGPRTVVSFGSCIWRALGVRPRPGHAPSAARGHAPRGPRAPGLRHTAWPACPSSRSTKKKASSRSTSEAACELSGLGTQWPEGRRAPAAPSARLCAGRPSSLPAASFFNLEPSLPSRFLSEPSNFHRGLAHGLRNLLYFFFFF